MHDTFAHTAVGDFLGRFGWLGVGYFFVLSGFVLMWSHDPQRSAREFLLRRVARIYPLHFFTLLMVLAFFALSGKVAVGYPGTAFGTLLNFLLVHDWVMGHPEIRQAWNGVSWSLSCEFMFYLSAPLLFPIMLRRGAQRAMTTLAALWTAEFLFTAFAAQQGWSATLDAFDKWPPCRLMEFALGAGLAMAMKEGWRFDRRYCAVAALLAPIVFVCLVPAANVQASLVEAITPGALLCVAAAASRDLSKRSGVMSSLPLVLLGESSYALYMLHTTAIMMTRVVAMLFVPEAATSALWGETFTALTLVFAMFVSVRTHLLLEKPARVWMLKKFAWVAPPLRPMTAQKAMAA